MTARGALVLLSSLLFAGCGPRSAEPAKAPVAPATTQPASPAPGYGAAPAPAEKAEPGSEAPASTKDNRDIEQAMPTLEDALAAFKQASSRLSTSGNDCHTACRALGSMRRSADRICELEPEGPEHRCKHARQRVKDAEKRVHSGCGGC